MCVFRYFTTFQDGVPHDVYISSLNGSQRGLITYGWKACLILKTKRNHDISNLVVKRDTSYTKALRGLRKSPPLCSNEKLKIVCPIVKVFVLFKIMYSITLLSFNNLKVQT